LPESVSAIGHPPALGALTFGRGGNRNLRCGCQHSCANDFAGVTLCARLGRHFGVGPWGGQSDELELTVEPGFRKQEAHVKSHGC
jgi:hypothetical protein